ncbi:MAG: MFS transporter [Pseudomonadota bacterium]
MSASASRAPEAGDKDGQPPTLLVIGVLYVAQGLPLGFAFEALPTLLRSAEVSLGQIALLQFVGLPWILKVLWAPFVDNREVGRLGRRRGWILTMQALLALCIGVVAVLPLDAETVQWTALAVFLGVMAAATQDIATDGLAAESLDGETLAWANTLQVSGMMAGFLIGGAGLLVAAELMGRQGAVWILALLLLLALVPALLWREPRAQASISKQPRTARLLGVFKRRSVWPLLVLIFFYGTLYTGGIVLTKLILVDAGWSLSGIGLFSALGGLALIGAGGPLGSLVCTRYGIWPALIAGLAGAGLGLCVWMMIAIGTLMPGRIAVGAATTLLGAGGGMASVAVYTLAMRFAAGGGQAGTDFTWLQSANVLGEMLIAGAVVGLAAAFGYGPAIALNIGCLAVLLAAVWAISRMETVAPLAVPAASDARRPWAEIVTDRLARRPSGWLGRRVYRRARAHRPGFRRALAALPVGVGDRVLDVGCGGGAFLRMVLDTGADAAGIDHSPDMLATTGAQNAAAVAAGRLELAAADAVRLPFPDKQFSHVFCLHAFFFFPEPAAAVREMARVLRPGGKLAILTMTPASEPKLIRLFGPIARRMRFDAPDYLSTLARSASLEVQGIHEAGDGSYLHVTRKMG